MENLKLIRVIFAILIIGMCFIIFSFSNQNGSESKSVSREFVRKIVDTLPQTKNKSESEKRKIVEDAQFFVRKLAHFSVYTALGAISMCFVSTYKISDKKRIIFSFGIGFIYAVMDEIHQIFSPGRTARVYDVAIDSVGVIFGILIIVGIINLIRKSRVKKQENKKQNRQIV